MAQQIARKTTHRCATTAALAHAELYLADHPEYAEDIQKFIQELIQIRRELDTAVRGKPKP